jgi:AraC-like DNA-binding protein
MSFAADTLVPAGALHANLQGAAALGTDMASLHAAVPDLPLTPDCAVPVGRYQAFWDAMERLDPRPGMVSAVAMAVPFGAFGVLDYLACSAETLRGVVETTRLHLSMVGFGTRIELADTRDGLFWITVHCDEPRPELAAEYTVAVLAHRLRLITNEQCRPRVVAFARVASDDESLRTRLFGVRPLFAQPVFGFALDAQWLDQPTGKSDPQLHATMRRIAASLHPGAARPDGLEMALRARLPDALASGDASPERLARLLGLSERTLQRRLAELGASFSAILEDFRREEAARLLQAGSLSLVRVAARLGYAEQTSFTRAFRRWYGATPAAWRRKEAAGSARR